MTESDRQTALQYCFSSLASRTLDVFVLSRSLNLAQKSWQGAALDQALPLASDEDARGNSGIHFHQAEYLPRGGLALSLSIS